MQEEDGHVDRQTPRHTLVVAINKIKATVVELNIIPIPEVVEEVGVEPLYHCFAAIVSASAWSRTERKRLFLLGCDNEIGVKTAAKWWDRRFSVAPMGPKSCN